MDFFSLAIVILGLVAIDLSKDSYLKSFCTECINIFVMFTAPSNSDIEGVFPYVWHLVCVNIIKMLNAEGYQPTQAQRVVSGVLIVCMKVYGQFLCQGNV